MFRKTPLTERISRFLENSPEASKIPLHPDDFNILKNAGWLNENPPADAVKILKGLPVTRLGDNPPGLPDS